MRIPSLLLAVALAGCGGSSSSGSVPPSVDVTGSWKGTWKSRTGASGSTSIVFSQTSGGAVSGTTTFSGSPCFSAAKIEGSVSGDAFTGRLVAGGIRVDLSGTAIGDRLEGTYDSVSAGACTGDTGTFSVQRAK